MSSSVVVAVELRGRTPRVVQVVKPDRALHLCLALSRSRWGKEVRQAPQASRAP
jgi:hypothetical protein